MDTDEKGKEIEKTMQKGKGMYFTSKDLLTGKTVTIEVGTGRFLKEVFGWLVKGITVNPPPPDNDGREEKK